MSDRPPALLLLPNVDAALSLASHGVTVLAPEARRLDAWRRVPHVPVKIRRIGQGSAPVPGPLLTVGRDFPGTVLLPGSDGSMLWAARNRDLLSDFRLATPSHTSIYALLNKRLLAEACRDSAIKIPRTWPVGSEEALQAVLPVLRYPALIKPQTRVGYSHWLRGIVVRNRDELVAAIARFNAVAAFKEDIVAYDPLVAAPLLQEYHDVTMSEVYHISGYIDATGELSAVRAKRKILQFPRRMGNGICCESAEVDEPLRDQLLELCRRTGYFGIFEAEFVPHHGAYLLIDFNPRFYNGMALDIARGLPLPWLAYLEAAGDRQALQEEIEKANSNPNGPDSVYCRRFLFHVLTLGQLASGGMSWGEFRRWRRWYHEHDQGIVDPMSSRDDRWLGRLHALSTLRQFARDPRYLYGTFIKRP